LISARIGFELNELKVYNLRYDEYNNQIMDIEIHTRNNTSLFDVRKL